MVQEKLYRRNNQRWSGKELDRLLRFVKLEDVTPSVERFYTAAERLERSPISVRAKWLDLRNAELRGQRAASPAVQEYVESRRPNNQPVVAEQSLDALVAAYRDARRHEEGLLARIWPVAAASGATLDGLRRALLGGEPTATPARDADSAHEHEAAAYQHGLGEEPRRIAA